jgi:hypothetical protein
LHDVQGWFSSHFVFQTILKYTKPMSLPIRRVTLYKHGLGFFERRGQMTGEHLSLEFPRPAMDDILKSLVVLDSLGQVLGLEFETPPDRNENVHRASLTLSSNSSLTDTLSALRGRNVRVNLSDQTIEGQVVGVDLETKNPLERAIFSLYQTESKSIVKFKLERLESLSILDAVAAGDLEFALQNAKRDEDRSSAVLRLSTGEHDLSVSYIAPAPAWRVSYRLIAEEAENTEADARDIFVQGWGLFDNTLEEDLVGVELSLMAGMPVSFRYALFAPNTPERPLVEDEQRTVGAPIKFDTMDFMEAAAPKVSMARARSVSSPPAAAPLSSQMMQSTQPVSSGESRGALFAYRVAHPVSVARGQSGMVPLLASKLTGKRELLYNGNKHPENPVASLRFENSSGLTLERGPVTVLEAQLSQSSGSRSAEYAGEAVLEFTPSGAEVIVAFAVELGIKVSEQQSWATRLERISVDQGFLLIQEYRSCHTQYEIISQLEKPVVVTLERDRLNGYDFFDTIKPVSQTMTLARWQVDLASKSKLEFVVQERALQSRYEQVRNLTFKNLSEYLKNKFLDSSTFEALKGIRAIYASIETINVKINLLESERERIFSRQSQIQANLAPLARDGDEGRLRSKLVKELDESENRLKAIETETMSLKNLILKLEQDATNAIAALEPKT